MKTPLSNPTNPIPFKLPILGPEENIKKSAVQLVEDYANLKMKNYVEPQRAGTPKGSHVGFPLNKMRAVYLMPLYPGLKLKEIAEKAGVSDGVLRFWRTTEEFKKAEKAACVELGKGIAKVVNDWITLYEIASIKKSREEEKKLNQGPSPRMLGEGEDEELLRNIMKEEIFNPHLVDILFFLNPSVREPLVSSLREKIDGGIGRMNYIIIGMRMLMRSQVKDQKTLRKWRAQPEILKITKLLIENYIEDLTDPEAWKYYGTAGIKELGEQLKRTIFDELDILAT